MATARTETREVPVTTVTTEKVHVVELSNIEVGAILSLLTHVGFYGKYRTTLGPTGKAALDVYTALSKLHRESHNESGIVITDGRVIVYKDTSNAPEDTH